jgi:hypothetical protein
LLHKIHNIRILENEFGNYSVVFDYSAKKKPVFFFKNLELENTEKAVDWLKEKIKELEK